jgi:group I intron endonuclease
MTSGVYGIVNKTNGKQYIGSSVNIEIRWQQHKHDLARGLHHSRHLQRAWDKYGGDNFDFVILELTGQTRLELLEAEQKWLDKIEGVYTQNGYNCWTKAAGPLGVKQSQETIDKRILSLRGEKSWRAKVTEDDVLAIRERAANGESYASIATDFPIGKNGIISICHRNNWKHVGGAERVMRDIDGSHHPGAILNESQVAEIKQRLCSGEKHHVIASDYGVRREVVTSIARGKAWDHVPWPAEYKGTKRLTFQEVSAIKRRLEDGETSAAIGRSVGIDGSYITRIASGEAWSEVPWPSGRGRAPTRFARGAELWSTKLTLEQAQEIKRRLAAGETPVQLAKFYPVERKSIAAIRDGKTWKYA